MNKSLALKNKLYLFFSLLFLFFIFLYLIYFLINADRGIITYFKIKNQNLDYEITLNKLKAQNNIYINRIKRLQPNTIDLDYLDEQIRSKTGFLDKDELVITFDE